MTAEAREPLELLALCTARSPAMLGGGSGGKPSTAAADLAAATAFGLASDPRAAEMSDGPWQVALAKFALDRGARYRAEIIWYAHVVRLAVRHSWQVERGSGRFAKLADATLRHHLDGSLCRGCHGACVTPEQQICPTCEGLGTQPQANVWWTQALDCHRNTFDAWEPRIRMCLTVLQDWEISIEQAIREGRKPGLTRGCALS